MANLAGKVEAEVEIKCDADEFFHSWGGKAHQLPNLCPEKLHNVEVHEGDWKTEGSAKLWTYVHAQICSSFLNFAFVCDRLCGFVSGRCDGKKKVAKEIIEAIDEEKKLVTFKVIEGDLMELYKTFIATVHVDTQGESNVVTWTFEYEKLNENVEDPNTLMGMCINMTKDIEAHHLQQ
ncbi:unnamed protein product [Ilex paraguariensis]|uniref:Bet v I/Major latex protein domain-containing protein n=1 Tax=Ilex paraguariensis TaxID=185542 RepID=A0ABC8UGW0_9AQUA